MPVLDSAKASLTTLPMTATPDKSIVYKSTPQGELTAHAFLPPKRRSGAAPAVVFFHGGGWRAGKPAQFFPQCRELAARGIVAFSIQYRLQDNDTTDMRTCVMDAKSALRWLWSHAAEFGVDRSKIAVGGGSAGGHLALACATNTAIDEAGDHATYPDAPPVVEIPCAVVAFNPVANTGPGHFRHQEMVDFWEDFSPRQNIPENPVPLIILHGEDDTLIPIESICEFQAGWRFAGGECIVEGYPEQGHGFFNYRDGDNPYYSRTLDAMIAFLAKVFR